ncbi:hypothetical protein yc1106_05753 [Curvularia clavata]|uniref:Uncharacterized protein n=1 Tax=Curvularia clavata TaxID=95742 RepID=A0A9Q8Z9G5_CURCL|nr:hypothetical protein yc1106_05753 [Curvularia clavata]
MSADLFAEFGADPTSGQQQQSVAPAKPGASATSDFGFFNDLANTPAPRGPSQQPPSTNHFQDPGFSSTTAAESDDNDDWGDFEGGSSEPAPTVTKQDPFAFASPQASQPQQTLWDITSSTHDPFGFSSQAHSQPSSQTWQPAPIVKAKKSADPSVLFDAEDEIDDDDFGDFEGVQKVETSIGTPATSSSALVDLLGDMNVSRPPPPSSSQRDVSSAKTPKSQATTKKSIKGSFGTVSKAKQSVSKSASISTQKDEEEWDEFDDWEASIPTQAPTKASSKPQAIKSTNSDPNTTAPPPILSPITVDPQPGELPPTNVPPPGVLLSLFPSLFAEAQEKLFKPMAAQPLPMRNRLLAEPATIAYLQGYLMLGNVAAHIIAGRKLRWKRDQHLSQGMRIGPASSRATSGMKLTGIDKGENMKEEREVSDVVRSWKEQVGRLRHVVAGVNQIKAGALDRGPDLQETMPVKTLKQSEGGIPARQPCMLCGLKREERVTAADMATDDSFGEWWIDQTSMHRGTFGISTKTLSVNDDDLNSGQA